MVTKLKHRVVEEVEFWVRHRILPLVQREGVNRLVFCQPQMGFEALPQGVEIVAYYYPQNQPSIQRRAWEVSRIWRKEKLCAFRFPHLAYVLEGTPEICLGTTVLRIPKDTLLLVPPDVPIDDERPHQRLLQSFSAVPAKLIWFLIAPSLVRTHICFSDSSRHFYTPLQFFFDPSVYPLVLALIDELRQKQEGYCDVATSYIVAVFWKILRAIKGIPLPSRCVSDMVQAFPEVADNSPPSQICRLVLQTFPNTPSVQILAKFVGMSPSHLRYAFKSQTGQSLRVYLRSLKLRIAQVLLQQTDLPISLIAHILGFHDPLYFSRWFRKAMGLSPSDLRQLYR
ncbi:MAG: helix-turn-helix transcriptional regulator [Candidatus Fervidibacter sp.]|uniref:helix-turn-helix transcriptional regulator n=1 Tax=Candidatus Fervidibacter sp. TaxID=3100871 RepID=UPI00404B186E